MKSHNRELDGIPPVSFQHSPRLVKRLVALTSLSIAASVSLSRANASKVQNFKCVFPTETKALGELRSGCNVAAAMKKAAKKGAGGAIPLTGHATLPSSYGIDGCLRNAWLHNLTAFLAARRKVPNGVVSVG